MPGRKTGVEFKFKLTADSRGAISLPGEETPFRILVLGDFSGRSSRNLRPPLRKRKPREVDCDMLDDLMRGLNVSLDLNGTPESAHIKFGSIADFHPDNLVEHALPLTTTFNLRQQLLNPDTFPGAAAALLSLTGKPATAPVQEQQKAPIPPSTESDEETLQRLLGRAPQRAQRTGVVQDKLQEIIRNAVGPSIAPGPDARQEELVSAVDLVLIRQLNGLLHNPEFQSLEASWRSLDFLVRNLEIDEQLGVYFLDVSFDELAEELNHADDLSFTAPYNWLVEDTVQRPGGVPWSLIVGNYGFSPTRPDHVELLGRIAHLSDAGNTVFLAGADPAVLDLSDPEGWLKLRTIPEAASVGLIYPRFLLRLPYGTKTEPIDAFDFEEMPGGPHLEDYLWGNGAFLVSCLLGRTFSEYGWDFTPGIFSQFQGLPVHTFREDGETGMTPCGELWLSDAMARKLESLGVMAMQSVHGQDAILVPRFHSLASPLTALRGSWTG